MGENMPDAPRALALFKAVWATASCVVRQVGCASRRTLFTG
ncbi:hypothetical protein A2U01_0118702 [Trifolium medium]|uniref:Uncharacterized protein n=1 Tax=Trifolium medium TaxID=97028 RepID=A0A392WEV2_9FABA|nr:hypothetical protein [Trifolium medium]